MKDLYMFLMANVHRLGELTKTSYYGKDYAMVEFEKNGKIYSVSIACEDKKEGEQ